MNIYTYIQGVNLLTDHDVVMVVQDRDVEKFVVYQAELETTCYSHKVTGSIPASPINMMSTFPPFYFFIRYSLFG